HSCERERQIVDALRDGPQYSPALVARIYVGLHPGLVWAAGLTVRAHLTKLEHDGLVAPVSGDVYRLGRGAPTGGRAAGGRRRSRGAPTGWSDPPGRVPAAGPPPPPAAPARASRDARRRRRARC